ncbi:MAG: TatD family hydrolase, partial [Candidatus Bipolaricaulota bacterium]|nr:TatD family hydrolase [Candidatus Bipolaricaulota bacterium]
SLDSSHEAVRLAERHRLIWATVGVHPHGAKYVTPKALRELEELAKSPRVVAIGEIGLDYYRDLSPRDVQRSVFAAQLELAKRLELPVVLHNRQSTDDHVAILRKVGRTHAGVVHSFLGDLVLAETFLGLGLHLGVGGPLTYPANEALRDAVRRVPLERIVLETDCPYLTPVPHRGKRNEPAYIELVAAEIARIRGISIDDVARQTTENALALFGIS